MWHTSKTKCAYRRELPGGGHATIEITTDTPVFGRTAYRGVVIVERRAVARRGAHDAPVVAVATGPSSEAVMQQLLPTAQSNAAIGTAFLHDPIRA